MLTLALSYPYKSSLRLTHFRIGTYKKDIGPLLGIKCVFLLSYLYLLSYFFLLTFCMKRPKVAILSPNYKPTMGLVLDSLDSEIYFICNESYVLHLILGFFLF